MVNIQQKLWVAHDDILNRRYKMVKSQVVVTIEVKLVILSAFLRELPGRCLY